jgi:hypothetical protein
MTRAVLPPRRYAEAFQFKWDDYPYRVCIGAFDDGRPCEVFVNAHKVDSALDAIAGDVAILISLLLQHGMTAAEIGHALRRNPNGTRVTIAGALADCIAAHRFKVEGTFAPREVPARQKDEP